jgi:hypothetical protein
MVLKMMVRGSPYLERLMESGWASYSPFDHRFSTLLLYALWSYSSIRESIISHAVSNGSIRLDWCTILSLRIRLYHLLAWVHSFFKATIERLWAGFSSFTLLIRDTIDVTSLVVIVLMWDLR